MSTNKVYGDAPNRIKLQELETRWDYDDPAYANGIAENLYHRSIQAFAVRRVQGRGGCDGARIWPLLRNAHLLLAGGCLTGPNHSGVELHGFLSYLVKCNLKAANTKFSATKANRCATTFIHWTWRASWRRLRKIPRSGEVYNLGGGKSNSCSILEAFKIAKNSPAKHKATLM